MTPADSTAQVAPITPEINGSAITVLLCVLLALAAFCVFELPSFFGKTPFETPELRVADVSREMLRSGDYVLPTLAGEPRLKKPPMPYWLTALAAKFFFSNAVNEPREMARAAQIVPALSAALAVLAAALAGCIFFGRTSGLIAGLLLASCELVMRFAQMSYCDATLMFFCAVSACAFTRVLTQRGGIIAALIGGIALGLGILTKGHVPLILLAAPLLVESIARRKLIGARQFLYAAGALVLAFAVAAPWFFMVETRHPGALIEMTNEAGDAVLQLSAADSETHVPHGHRQNDRWSYYFYKGVYGLLPWTPLALMGLLAWFSTLRRTSRIKRVIEPHVRFFAIYALAGFLIFLLVEKKQDYYLLPLLPAAALVFGSWLGSLNAPGGFVKERLSWLQLAFGIVGAAAILCLPWYPAGLEWLRGKGIGTGGYLAAHAAEFTVLLSPYAAGLALGFLLLNVYCARQWVNGRALAVVLIFAALGLGASAYAAARPGARDRHDAIWASVDKVKAALDAAAPEALLFAPGLDDALVLFYMGRKPHSLMELADDKLPAAPAILLVRGDSLKRTAVNLNFSFDNGIRQDDSPEFSLFAIGENSPGAEALKKAVQAFQQSKIRR